MSGDRSDHRTEIAQARRDFRSASLVRPPGQEAADEAARREADVRSWIARWTVGGFSIYIIAVLLTVVCRGFYPTQLGEAVTTEVELLKIAILPLMTLVLGYFFSRPNR